MYTLHFRDWDPGLLVEEASRPGFLIKRDGEYHFPAAISVSNSKLGALMTNLGDEEETARHAVEQVLLRWSVHRIEEGLRTGELRVDEQTTDIQLLSITDDDMGYLTRLIEEKRCGYQVRQERELYCSAAGRNDPSTVGTLGLKAIAPTSMPVCQACALPAAELICSHLVHPEVVATETFESWSRLLGPALCEKGRPEIQHPEDCRPNGHECWERVMAIGPSEIDEALPPMALPEAFDYLDAIWRLAFDKKHLLQMHSAKDVAGIAQPCSSRTDFEERVIDLADLISNLQVDETALPTGLTDEQKQGSLNRIEYALRLRLSNDSFERTRSALTVLRRVQTIRNGFGHSGAAKKLPAAFSDLGLPYPPPSWGGAWDLLRSQVIRALAHLRDEVRLLT